MDNIYELGDVVFERVRPNQKLIIKQRNDKTYYCVPQENLKGKVLVFHARDLKGSSK